MRVMFLVMAVVLGIGFAAGQETQVKVTLQLTDVDISDALTQLSQQGKVTILGDSSVKGKVSCSLNEVLLEDALGTICKMNKLVWLKVQVLSEEKPFPGKVLGVIEAVNKIEAYPVILEDTQAKSVMIFIPNAPSGSIDVAAISKSLKLKTVYLVKSEAKLEKPSDEPETETVVVQPEMPPVDPGQAATRAWEQMVNVPMEQRVELFQRLLRYAAREAPPELKERLKRATFALEGPEMPPPPMMPPMVPSP